MNGQNGKNGKNGHNGHNGHNGGASAFKEGYKYFKDVALPYNDDTMDTIEFSDFQKTTKYANSQPLLRTHKDLLLSEYLFVFDIDNKVRGNYKICGFCFMYVSLMITCLVLNRFDEDDVGGGNNMAYKEIMHYLEFWGNFLFSIATIFSLSYSVNIPMMVSVTSEEGQRTIMTYENRQLRYQYFIIFASIIFNVTSTFVTSMLITIDLERYKFSSHVIEYFNDFLQSCMDLIIWLFIWGNYTPRWAYSSRQIATLVFMSLFVVLSILLLVLWAKNHEKYETLCHYIEFPVEIYNSVVIGYNCYVTICQLQKLKAGKINGVPYFQPIRSDESLL